MTNPIQQWNRMTAPTAPERKLADRAAQKASAETTERPAPAPVATDEVKLSAIAQEAVNADVPFDRVKVEQIKEAVKSGNYPLDARRMAESFLAIEKMIKD